MSTLFPTNASRISRALDLEAKAHDADRRWPEAPSVARNLRWAANMHRSYVADACLRAIEAGK